jgi:hypothetical protein
VKSRLPFGCESPPEPPRDEIQPLDAQLARLHVTVSRRLLEKLEAAKDALAHACPGATAAEVFERGLDLVLDQHAKHKGLVEKPRKEPRVEKPRKEPRVEKPRKEPRGRSREFRPSRRRSRRFGGPPARTGGIIWTCFSRGEALHERVTPSSSPQDIARKRR